ncbi:MAG: hypothetical protein HYZ26_07795 [Chloroflexi bacterium]|nr:hypothetical protein [Chloroflexota bacterium]
MALPERRPASVTWLAAFVLIIAMGQLGRALFAWRQMAFLGDLAFSLPPAVWILSGVLLGAGGLAAGTGLWLGRRWAAGLTAAGAVAFVAYAWLERLALSASPLAGTNTAFALAATLIILTWVAWILTRPQARSFFGANHERKQQN